MQTLRLFIVPYFPVRSSRSSAMLYGGGGGGNRGRDCHDITAARVTEAWQKFHIFYHSFINKISWHKENMSGTFSTDFACLQMSPFETVILQSYNFWDIHPNSIGKHAQVKHFPNCSAKHVRLTTIKLLNLPIKSRAFLTGRLSYVGVALNFNSLCRNGVRTFPWPGCFKLKAC